MALHQHLSIARRYGPSVVSTYAMLAALSIFAGPALAGGPTDFVSASSEAETLTEELKPRLVVRFDEPDPIFLEGEIQAQRFAELNNFLKFAPRASDSFSFADLEMRLVSAIGGNSGVFELDGLPGEIGIQQAELLEEIAQRVSELDGVAYAEVEPIATIQDTPLKDPEDPQDPKLKEMWHLTGAKTSINAPRAWPDVTGEGVVVAVVDTGYLEHQDLKPNLLEGYDFVSDVAISNDNDGWDDDASDPGDWCRTRPSSWHGTHVAGTIAAAANQEGVVGVAYNSKILPVRVLGQCGGYGADIAAGIRWAAGIPVPGTRHNTNPAHVINLSLGGQGRCGRIYQDAIDDAIQAGATVVVAAGNSNQDVKDFTPANCDDVITVASSTRVGSKANYSNFGEMIDIAAPGGETRPNVKDGVLSTLNDGQTIPGNDTYEFYQGTSMAAPHVAGIAAMIYEVQTGAKHDSVLEALVDSAKPFPQGVGDDCSMARCGAGIADASAALFEANIAVNASQDEPPIFGASGDIEQTLIVPHMSPNGWVGIDSEGWQYPTGMLETEPDMSPSAEKDGSSNPIEEWIQPEDEHQRIVNLPTLSPYEGEIGPEVIHGDDNRVRVANTTRFPESAQVLVVLPNGRCSGAMIGPDLVLTAGHCVHRNGNWQRSARVYPGRNGRQAPFGSCNATRFYSVLGWTRDANPAYDFGAIKLNCDVGNRTGWLGFFWQSASLVGTPARISSYPGDKPLEQWTHTDRVRSNSTLQTRYLTDTVGGNSGSGVFANSGVPAGCGHCAHTVHAYGATSFNAGTRITKPLFENLINWRNAPKGNALDSEVRADLN